MSQEKLPVGKTGRKKRNPFQLARKEFSRGALRCSYRLAFPMESCTSKISTGFPFPR